MLFGFAETIVAVRLEVAEGMDDVLAVSALFRNCLRGAPTRANYSKAIGCNTWKTRSRLDSRWHALTAARHEPHHH